MVYAQFNGTSGIKRLFNVETQYSFFFHIKLVGVYFITSAILLLSHVTLFHLLTNNGKFKDPSVISNTWELFMMELRGETSTTDLGGEC